MKQTSKISIEHVSRTIALDTRDTSGSSLVTMHSLAEETHNVTGYTEDRPYSSLGLDATRSGEYHEKDELLSLANRLASQASSTIGTRMDEEERKETMASRYEKLLKVINDYENAPAEVRYAIATDINKAINAMNREQMPIPQTFTVEEQSFIDNVSHIQYLSSTASDELHKAFAEYRTLPDASQRAVLPELQSVYASYVSFNKYTDGHDAIKDEYKELPKRFSHTISFDTNDFVVKTWSEESEEIHTRLQNLDGHQISYDTLSKTVTPFHTLDAASQSALYSDYRMLVADYMEAHPRSKNAAELYNSLMATQMGNAENHRTSELLANVRMLNETTIATREVNMEVARTIIEQYQTLEQRDKDAVKGIVLDSLQHFNNFELQNVVRPVERDVVEVAEQRYSAKYYEIKDDLSSDNAAALGRQVVAELSYVEQCQMFSSKFAKENPAFANPIQEEISRVTDIRSGAAPTTDAEMIVYAEKFSQLSEQDRLFVFHDFIEKYNASSQSTELNTALSAIPDFNSHLRDTYRAAFETDMTMKQYTAVMDSISHTPSTIKNTLAEDTLDFYSRFANAHPSSLSKINDVYSTYLANNSEEIKISATAPKFDELKTEKAFIEEFKSSLSGAGSFDREQMKQAFAQFDSLEPVQQAMTAEYLNNAFNTFASAHPKMAVAEDVQALHIHASEVSMEYARACADAYSRDITENPAANAAAMKKQILAFEALPEEAQKYALGSLTSAYLSYEEGSKTLTLNEQFSRLIQAAPADSMVVIDFQNNHFSENTMREYAAMPYAQKVELYQELAAQYEANGIAHKQLLNTVETQFESTIGKYIDAYTSGESKMIREEIAVESRLALTSPIKTDSLELVREYQEVTGPFEYERALADAAAQVRTKLIAEEEREAAMTSFKQDCMDLDKALDFRGSIVYARTIEDLDRVSQRFADLDQGVQSWLADTYERKVSGFYNSGAANNEIYYGGFIHEGDNTEMINLRVDGFIGPNCFVGHIPGKADEQILVLTNEPIDVGITRETKDLYSIVSGIPMIEVNETFEKNARFDFDKNGSFILEIPRSIDNELGEKYSPASINVKQQFEVLNVAPQGFGSIITVRNTENDDILELSTSLKPKDIARQASADVVIEGDKTLITSAAHPTNETIEQDVRTNSENVYYSRIASVSDTKTVITPAVINAMDEHNFVMKDDKLSIIINGSKYEVEKLYPQADNTNLVAYKQDGTTQYMFSDKSTSEIAMTAFARDVDLTIKGEDTIVTNFKGEPCLKYTYDDEYKFGAIVDIKNVDGKATFTVVDENKNLVSVATEMRYSEALNNFENKYINSSYLGHTQVDSVDFVKNEDGKIIATGYSSEHTAVCSGQVLSVSNNQMVIRDETNALLMVKTEPGLVEQLQRANDVTTVKDGSEILIGRGESTANLFDPEYSKNNSFNVEAVKLDKQEFLKRDFELEHLGDELHTSQRENGKVVHGKILYMNAELLDDTTIHMTVVEQSRGKITAYDISELSQQEFRQIIELTKIHEANLSDEARQALECVHRGEYTQEDMREVVKAFNATQSDAIAADNISHRMEPGDLARAELIEKNGDFILKAQDENGKSVTIVDPVIRKEQNELFVYSVGSEGAERHRIVSSAFGAYSDIEAASIQKAFDWSHIIEDQANRIYNNVNVEYTVTPNLTMPGKDMRALFEERVGLSCETTSGNKISSGHLSVNDETKIALNYGVLIQDTKEGPQFTYFNPSSESTLYSVASVKETTKYLPIESIPKTPQEAVDNKFVLIDYTQGVAIREGGLCYKLNQKDLTELFGESRPNNYYNQNIASAIDTLEKHAQFVSPEQFAGKTNDLQPSVNDWSISISSTGKPMLSFSEASASSAMSTIGNDYEIRNITVGNDGKTIYAELANPLGHDSNSTGNVSTVRLCMPSEHQFEVMEKATANTIGDAQHKIQHYFEQVNELANGVTQDRTLNNKLEVGHYVVVQTSQDEPGVLYKVVGANRDLLIVGGTDNAVTHPVVLSADALDGKNVTQLDNPLHPALETQLRFERSIVYAEVGKDSHDNVTSVTIGNRVFVEDGMEDGNKARVEGNTYRCSGVELDHAERVNEREGDVDISM